MDTRVIVSPSPWARFTVARVNPFPSHAILPRKAKLDEMTSNVCMIFLVKH